MTSLSAHPRVHQFSPHPIQGLAGPSGPAAPVPLRPTPAAAQFLGPPAVSSAKSVLRLSVRFTPQIACAWRC